MWFKMGNGTYFDTDHSTILGASGNEENGYYVECVTPHTGGNPRRLREGYESKEDAQEYLNEFMDGIGFHVMPGPDSEEDEEFTEEDEELVATDDYDRMSIPDLKNLITTRNETDKADPDFDGELMSTQGRKDDLIQRLREDDARRSPVDETV